MSQRLFAIGWARHGADVLAMALAPIKNQSPYSQLNSLPTRSI